MRAGFSFLLAAVLFLTASGVRADGVLERAKARGGLVAAAVPDALPLAARNAEGKLVGFDIDVAREIAKRLGLPVTFVTPGWDTILAGRWNGRWDFSVSNITPTEARSRRLDFPVVYRFEAVVVVVRAGDRSITKPADVSGKRIGVKRDTTFEKYLQHDLTIYAGETPLKYAIDKPDIRPYPDKDKALTALAQSGPAVVDAVVTSYSTAQAAIDGGAPVRIVPGFLFWEPVAVAVVKGDDGFARRIGTVVEAMLDDGTLNDLSIKWFGIDMTAPVMQ
ncbi:MAG: transporter substrate-binding domain-containing protein [Alphaproteobacteria bacterium]|nr:transporter substrate-binding domain-containing protein [Alphaproteobacteria bacterium]